MADSSETPVVWLDNARLVASFAVVLLHMAFGFFEDAVEGTSSWWATIIYDSMARWCVPVFVMISGALLLDPCKKESIGAFYKKRVSKIFVPLVFWTGVYTFWNLYKNNIKDGEESVGLILEPLTRGEPHYHMWYIYMIAVLYLFVPFFRKVVERLSRRELLILVLVSFFLATVEIANSNFINEGKKTFINMFPSFVPYFFCGHLIRVYGIGLSKLASWGVFVASVVLTTAGFYIVSELTDLKGADYFYEYLGATVIPMSIAVMALLRSTKAPFMGAEVSRILGPLTLGIYLVHPLLWEVSIHLGLDVFSVHPALGIPLFSVAVYVLSAFTVMALRDVPFLRRVT